MGVLVMDWLGRRSRHRTYSLNWDESTPPPQEALMVKPFWKRRSRTCGKRQFFRSERFESELLIVWILQFAKPGSPGQS